MLHEKVCFYEAEAEMISIRLLVGVGDISMWLCGTGPGTGTRERLFDVQQGLFQRGKIVIRTFPP